jgi:multiple sugar transport system ATP-binding protein
VEKNLSFGLRIAKVPADEIRRRVDRAAEILQIGRLLQRKPAELSGGQRQRVAMGRALVRDVDVFLFDEPLSNLDAKLRSELRVELKRLHQRLGNTMIYVTHDQIEALTLADRIAVMKSGVIQQLDAPQTIYNRPKNLYVAGFLGSPAMNFVKGTIQARDGGFVFDTGTATVPLSGYVGERAGLRAGPAILGLRPEHIGVGNGSGMPEAEVELVETMGSDSLVWLRHGGQPISARVESTRRYQIGERLGVKLDLSLASLFDVETQERL